MTSDTSNSKADALLELFNSDQNAHGEYCQVIIGSPTARDGINLFNVVRAFLVTPGWHPSGMHQALSRFLRSISHEALLNEKRRQRVAEILPGLLRSRLEAQIEPSEAEAQALEEAELQAKNEVTIEVKIYKMASIPASGDSYVQTPEGLRRVDLQYSKPATPHGGSSDDDESIDSKDNRSVDLQLYQHSERKDLHIKRMMRYLKRCAWDALLNYDRNVRVNDVDGSPICDYDLTVNTNVLMLESPLVVHPEVLAKRPGSHTFRV